MICCNIRRSQYFSAYGGELPGPLRFIYHKRDETIRGHVFCSFLALTAEARIGERPESAIVPPRSQTIAVA